jgi:hypothetical protein
VRYTSYLFDRQLEYRAADKVESGRLWAIHRAGSEFDTLSLINASPTDEWNVVKRQPATRRNVAVQMPSPARVRAVYAANPDGGADAIRLEFAKSSGKLRFTIPSVRIWTLIVVVHD